MKDYYAARTAVLVDDIYDVFGRAVSFPIVCYYIPLDNGVAKTAQAYHLAPTDVSVGWTHEFGFLCGECFDKALALFDIMDIFVGWHIETVSVVHGVVADLMSLADDFPHEVWIAENVVAYDKECSLDVVLTENCENLPCCLGAWTVVESKEK